MPHLPKREEFRGIDGPPRTSPTSWPGITVRGSYVEPARTFAAERTGS